MTGLRPRKRRTRAVPPADTPRTLGENIQVVEVRGKWHAGPTGVGRSCGDAGFSRLGQWRATGRRPHNLTEAAPVSALPGWRGRDGTRTMRRMALASARRDKYLASAARILEPIPQHLDSRTGK